MINLPNGLWPVMLTTFDEQLSLDVNGLERLTHFYLETGANGLFANCLSSEMFQLTGNERLSLVKKVLEIVDNRVPVVATGTFGKDINQHADFIKQLFDLGVKAVVINLNQATTNVDSEDLLKRNIELLLHRTPDIPLGLYECPVPYKRLVAPGLLKELSETHRFVYYKETSCNLNTIREKVKAIEETPLKLYNADTTSAFYSLIAGTHGLSNIGMNYVPELYNYLFHHAKEDERQSVIGKLHSHLSAMDALFHQKYPISAKYFLYLRGLAIHPYSRVRADTLNQQDIIRLKALRHLFIMLAEELEIEIPRWNKVR